MAKIKLNLASQSVDELGDTLQKVITKMGENAALFTTPKPTLAQLGTTLNNIKSAIANVKTAEQLVKQRYQEQAAARKAVEAALTEEAGYVESVVKGDPAKITMAGMDVRAEPTPVGPLAKVLNLAASEGDHDGTVDLQWDPVKGNRLYEIETSPNGNDTWTPKATSTKSVCTVTGLTAGNKVWFRVRANGAAGPGPWSDPAMKIVP